jgi:predicted ATPase
VSWQTFSPFYLSDSLTAGDEDKTFLHHNLFLNLAEWLAAFRKISQITISNKNKNLVKTTKASCQASHTVKPY